MTLETPAKRSCVLIFKGSIGSLEDLKSESFEQALEHGGQYSVRRVLLRDYSAASMRTAREVLRREQGAVVLVRSGPVLFTLADLLMTRRSRQQDVVVEVPTPYRYAIREVLASGRSVPRKYLLAASMLAQCPLMMWAIADRVIQYAPEGRLMRLGVGRKTVLTSNGLVPGSVHPPLAPYDGTEVRLVSVATASPWHGLDRLLRGLASYEVARCRSDKPTVRLMLVGDGPEMSRLATLVQELGICHLVEWTGRLRGEQLKASLSRSHIGVGVLGGHRRGLVDGSPLKHREYALAGLPFFYSGRDYAFDPPPQYVLRLASEESPVDVESIVDWFSGLTSPNLWLEIRQDALERVDLRLTLPPLLSFSPRSPKVSQLHQADQQAGA